MSDRRKFVKQGVLAAGAVAFLRPFKSVAWAFEGPVAEPLKLTILHTSDLHAGSNFLSTSSSNIGSIAKAVAKVRSEKANILLVNSGNLLNAASGNEAEHVAHLNKVQELGYSAVVPGAKDLEKGTAYLAELASQSQLKVVASNASHSQILPYEVVNKGNLKVGIIGLAGQQLASTTSLRATAEKLNKTADHLKSTEACHAVVCLSYNDNKKHKNGIKNDIAFAALSSNIDVIISGNNAAGKITRAVRNADKHEVLVASSGNIGAAVGRIDITFNEAFEKTHVHMCQVNV